MLRFGLAFFAVVAAAVSPAVAGFDEVRQAFDEVASDPARLGIYCEMSAYIASTSDDVDDAKVEAYLVKLGARFEKAWNSGDEFAGDDEASRKLDAALDALAAKCGKH